MTKDDETEMRDFLIEHENVKTFGFTYVRKVGSHISRYAKVEFLDGSTIDADNLNELKDYISGRTVNNNRIAQLVNHIRDTLIEHSSTLDPGYVELSKTQLRLIVSNSLIEFLKLDDAKAEEHSTD